MYKIQTGLNLRSKSFVHRSVNLWNSIPASVVNSPRVEAFERRLDKFCKDIPIKYDLEEIYNVRSIHQKQYETTQMRI